MGAMNLPPHVTARGHTHEMIQRAYDRAGPDERRPDWLLDESEPWRTLREEYDRRELTAGRA